MQQNDENTNAFLIHISAFAGYLFPFGSIITPLIIWQTLKKRSYFLDEHGKQAVNFNISFGIYIFILSASFFSIIFGNFFDVFNGINVNIDFGNNHFSNHGIFGVFGAFSLVGLITLIKIALIIIAAMKANKGENYKYPFTINFIK
ncbi:DUF4870 domain-containing protein [Tenacibaculum sp. 190524A02b]|uniref:DUF4870 domain-containing protein n=1 Tax=Tenacibaculum vairaonense TaxID=3137860 RepID=A0ABM9PNK2_9FLAO